MIEEIKGQSIPDKIRNSDDFYDYFNRYKGRNNNAARRLLNDVLDEDEKDCLLEVLFGLNGWHVAKQGAGFYKLRFTAWTLDFTNPVLYYNETGKGRLVETVDSIQSQELDILKSVYIKQKLATYQTLRNLGYAGTILLYRGIIAGNELEQYALGNLESWTENERVAQRFIGNSGYVIFKEFKLEDIFLCYNSIYKTDGIPPDKIRAMIKKEQEFIVENTETIICRENFYRC